MHKLLVAKKLPVIFPGGDLVSSHFCISVSPFGLKLPPTRLLHSSASECTHMVCKARRNVSVAYLSSSKNVMFILQDMQCFICKSLTRHRYQ